MVLQAIRWLRWRLLCGAIKKRSRPKAREGDFKAENLAIADDGSAQADPALRLPKKQDD